MAKLYGNRWEGVEGNLGEGGQSRVLTVVDKSDKAAGHFALKRILNPKRDNRFRNEVEAIKTLSHPNIVPLIDHSALDAVEPAEDTKRYLVMPIAHGGNLARIAAELYMDLSRVLDIAIQVAEALKAAHAANIVHRDIKPENILLSGDGDHVWVCDFGVCLIDDGRPRGTLDDEVVGPVMFMAPELEGGGNLDVTAAADIYSLGKLIYFLFTGGVRLPRENLGDDKYARPLATPGLEGLRLLLAQMICPLDRRLRSMDAVLTRLHQLRSPARPEGLSEAGHAARDKAIAKIAEDERQQAARREEERNSALMREAAVGLLSRWIADQAEAGANALHVEGALKASTQVSKQAFTMRVVNRRLLALQGVEVSYQKATSAKARIWALTFYIYQAPGGHSKSKLGVVMSLELREADQSPVNDCTAFLKREAYGAHHLEFQVTDTEPALLEFDEEEIADTENKIRAWVRDAVSALPDLASRDASQFIVLRLPSNMRGR
ncbi:protein kinase domain-containing protein [Metarhizobium album]|uniref:protein kinase domain-containing protein n=1 Tax=Metarhizobium album TaxID=2182425 RepID=UPI001402F5DE|nr:protein kinase [Rhizobium album]